MARGSLIVLSAPAGTGKTTIANRLVDGGGFLRAITATTRAPRGRERDGVDYFFLTVPAFEAGIARDEFLEHARVFGNFYGVPRHWVEQTLAQGKRILLVIDVQGAMTVKSKFADALLVFLLPPSREELERRIRGRGEDDEATIQTRLETAAKEMQYRDRYDFCVVNDDVERAAAEIRDVVARRETPGGRT